MWDRGCPGAPGCFWLRWCNRRGCQDLLYHLGEPPVLMVSCCITMTIPWRTQEGWGQSKRTWSLKLSVVSMEEKLSKETGKAHMGSPLKRVIQILISHPCLSSGTGLDRAAQHPCVFTAAIGLCTARGDLWEQMLLSSLLGNASSDFTQVEPMGE